VRSLERLIAELEYDAVRPGPLSVWVAYKDGRARAGDGVVTTPTVRFDLLLLAAKQWLSQSWILRVPVTRLYLVATDLRYPGEVQLGLFEPPPERAEAVARLKREVNARVGRFALRSTATLYLNDLYRDEAAGYDICDVRGKMCF
jgi:hypothetical protein